MTHLLETKISDAEIRREDMAVRLPADAIKHMEKDELLELQAMLGFGGGWGLIIVPSKWRPANKRGLSERSCDIRNALPPDINPDSELGQQAIKVVLRVSLVNYLYTNSHSCNGTRRISISTWLSRTRCLTRLAREALKRSDGSSVYHPLSADHLREALASDKVAILRILGEYRQRGLIDEFPVLENPRNLGFERSRRGAGRPTSPVDAPLEYLPFSDQFVGEMGWRCLWLSKELGPALIDCAEGILQAEPAAARRTDSSRKSALPVLRAAFLSRFEWVSPSGHTIDSLPFELKFQSERSRGVRSSSSWKPVVYKEIKKLLHLLQTAHLFLMLLSAGSRIGEIASLREGCLMEAPDGAFRIQGRTYKLVENEGGEIRDWPLPDDLVLLLRQQQRLARFAKTRLLHKDHIEHDALWVPLRHQGSGLVDEAGVDQDAFPSFNSALKELVRSFGLTHLAGNINPHPHRFRKTLARLIGLALVGSPKILMDIFGHKSIDMALKYIHSDKNLRAEIEEVAKGQIILLAKDAVGTWAQNGGAAAARVKQAVKDLRARRGDVELGIDDIHELASLLTLGGTSWQLVRPGVVCTKSLTEFGPCTRNVGRPQPSSCRSSCTSRLELAALRDDVDRALQEAVEHLRRAYEEDDEMAVSLWVGQIHTHLPRFEDLKVKWSSHPLVRRAIDVEAT
jgi:integrase